MGLGEAGLGKRAKAPGLEVNSWHKALSMKARGWVILYLA